MIGLWILTVVSRPLDAKKLAVVLAMCASLVILLNLAAGPGVLPSGLAAGGFAAGSPRRCGGRRARPRAPGLDPRPEVPAVSGARLGTGGPGGAPVVFGG